MIGSFFIRLDVKTTTIHLKLTPRSDLTKTSKLVKSFSVEVERWARIGTNWVPIPGSIWSCSKPSCKHSSTDFRSLGILKNILVNKIKPILVVRFCHLFKNHCMLTIITLKSKNPTPLSYEQLFELLWILIFRPVVKLFFFISHFNFYWNFF